MPKNEPNKTKMYITAKGYHQDASGTRKFTLILGKLKRKALRQQLAVSIGL